MGYGVVFGLSVKRGSAMREEKEKEKSLREEWLLLVKEEGEKMDNR